MLTIVTINDTRIIVAAYPRVPRQGSSAEGYTVPKSWSRVDSFADKHRRKFLRILSILDSEERIWAENDTARDNNEMKS